MELPVYVFVHMQSVQWNLCVLTAIRFDRPPVVIIMQASPWGKSQCPLTNAIVVHALSTSAEQPVSTVPRVTVIDRFHCTTAT